MSLPNGYYKIRSQADMRFLEYNQYTGRISTITAMECGDVFLVQGSPNESWTLKTKDNFVSAKHGLLSPLVGSNETHHWRIEKATDSGDNVYSILDQGMQLAWVPDPRQGDQQGDIILHRYPSAATLAYFEFIATDPEVVPEDETGDSDEPGAAHRFLNTGLVEDCFIVTLKQDRGLEQHLTWLRAREVHYSQTEIKCKILDEYELINGYSAYLNGEALREVRSHDDVELVSEDVLCNWNTHQDRTTWGLRRISTDARLPPLAQSNALDHTYRCDSTSPSTPVDVYVLDSGILTSHLEFGGRASFGRNFTTEVDGDRYGHGTHVAGTIAGNRYGVTKSARVISVKVGHDRRIGPASRNIVAGIQWACRRAMTSGRASVINLSLGRSGYTPLDLAVTRAVQQGLHVVAAAGNEGLNAGHFSPARAIGAITVGASDIHDTPPNWSNHGSVVDIYAPGVNIWSAGIRSDDDIRLCSGTSMAAPHVAGVIAYLISQHGNRTPPAMIFDLQSLAIVGAINNIPPGTRYVTLRNLAWVLAHRLLD